MVKQKKKRNKTYTGPGAVNARPVVTRISAANRNRTSQWLYDRRRFIKPALIITGILLLVIVLGIGIVSMIVGH